MIAITVCVCVCVCFHVCVCVSVNIVSLSLSLSLSLSPSLSLSLSLSLCVKGAIRALFGASRMLLSTLASTFFIYLFISFIYFIFDGAIRVLLRLYWGSIKAPLGRQGCYCLLSPVRSFFVFVL
jgi:hypothetical protein